MNDLIISNSISTSMPQTPEKKISKIESPDSLIALDSLLNRDDWLQNKKSIKKAISELKTLKPENWNDCSKILTVFNKIESSKHFQLLSKEKPNEFQELSMEIIRNFVTISSTGVLDIEIRDNFQKKQWDCLSKISQFLPITHIEFHDDRNIPTDKDLDELLKFIKLNPSIVSLDLGLSLNITDEYLEQLSEYLPNIQTFCLESALITAIPTKISDRVTKLSCRKCKNLTSIASTTITILNCFSCKVLEIITAPNVTTLDCAFCPALTSIYIPMVINLDCEGCDALKTIIAPDAKTIDCGYCDSLTSIRAPNTLKLDCNDCIALVKIDALEVTHLDCSNCEVLENINVPKAIKIDCSSCTRIRNIIAPNVLRLDCDYCMFLTAIDAPKVIELSLIDCYDLTRKVKFDLFKIVYRNNMLTHMDSSNVSFYQLNNYAFSMYEIRDLNIFPLNSWFTQAKKLIIPAEFASPQDEEMWRERVADLLTKLFDIVSKDDSFKNINISFFQNLKKFNRLHQEIKRITWLATIFACNNGKLNPLSDKIAAQSITTINELTDPLLQKEASRLLFSLYEEIGNDDRYKIWESITLKNIKPHLILPSLFFSASKISEPTIRILMKCLEPMYYKNIRILFPILEMICLLSKASSLSKEDQEKILKFIFIPFLEVPKKRRDESKMDFNSRKAEYECINNKRNQRRWIGACRDFLLFGIDVELKNINSGQKLLGAHQDFCKKFFGVEEDQMENFSKTFTSKRSPDGLFTYVARLQFLPDNERILLTEMLGKFVNSCLKKEFPANRYDLNSNLHLKNLFENRLDLLEEWKKPYFKNLLNQINQSDKTSPDSLQTVIKNKIKSAIENKHLREDKNAFSIPFITVLESENFDIIKNTIQTLENQLTLLKSTLSSEEIYYRQIEIDCLSVLVPDISPQKRIRILYTLLKKLPDSLEFKNDVEGMIRNLTTSETQSSYKSVESAESWEDFLLMGTEVDNSCQRIDGDPNLNKGLLSYILDGKNKVIIIKNSQGIIIARTVLRILWDKAKDAPVLFMERIYTRGANQELSILIKEACIDITKKMGLPLVGSKRDFPNHLIYKGTLTSLEGPAPFEYVDALAGIQNNGQFEISVCSIIFSK